MQNRHSTTIITTALVALVGLAVWAVAAPGGSGRPFPSVPEKKNQCPLF